MRKTRVGSVEQRFFQRFSEDTNSGCWNWTGTKNPSGYGVIGGKIGGRRVVPAGSNMLAHRVSWMIHFGEIPNGEGAHGTVVMHACDNPACVNPKHLRLGTQADNVKDMNAKGRKVSGTPSGVEHWLSSFKHQADIDLVCSTVGRTKELAERFGVTASTIKRVRKRNMVKVEGADKFRNKPLSPEAIAHIRSTPSGTRGLGKLYGVGNTTIANIRNGLTHRD